jgi:hypothetical protein
MLPGRFIIGGVSMAVWVEPDYVEEIGNSPESTFSRNDHSQRGQATRTLRIPWANFAEYFSLVMPSGYVDGGEFVLPPSASFPSIPYLFATKISVKPWPGGTVVDGGGQGESPPAYRDALVEIGYQTQEFNQDANGPGASSNDMPGGPSENQTFVSHKIGASGEFITYSSAGAQ